MKNEVADRRIARTRVSLQHALLNLIKLKGYDAIRVEDICREANVGRSTFYLHFASKDALKRSGFEHLREQLTAMQNEALETSSRGANLGFSLALFEHARDHIDLYRALIGGGGQQIAFEGLKEILADLVRQEITTFAEDGDFIAAPAELIVQFVVGAYLSVLTWWLDRGAEPPPRILDEMVRKLATRGFATEEP